MCPLSYEEEKEESLYLESLSDAEFHDRQMGLQAKYEGSDRPEDAWLLTDYDYYVPNPAYVGPPVPHPEFDYDEDVPF